MELAPSVSQSSLGIFLARSPLPPPRSALRCAISTPSFLGFSPQSTDCASLLLVSLPTPKESAPGVGCHGDTAKVWTSGR